MLMMRKWNWALALPLLLAMAAFAEEEVSRKDRDREAILAMAGTFVVDFTFKETTPFALGYEPKEPYRSNALEVVVVDEESQDRIVLQHLLQTESGRVVKHWRQDWDFQNTRLWEYQGHNVWTLREITPEEAEGTWTQSVYEVSDSPRYSATGKWVHDETHSEWRSEITNRPLPRREYTTRDDYHILRAINTHALTQTGWVHEQDNTKIVQDGDKTEALVREMGLNVYDRTLESRCSIARQWWRDHRPFWMDVRAKWDKVLGGEQRSIHLADAVEEGPLHEHLFALCTQSFNEKEYKSAEAVPQIESWIDRFLAESDSERPSAQVGQAE
jgi:hypothetical protein